MILVDGITSYDPSQIRSAQARANGRQWCHMMTDDLTPARLEELHAMALEIGLRRTWFQDHVTLPHYDLVPSKRRLAVRAGAVEVESREMIRRCFRGTWTQPAASPGKDGNG